jgi:hypothetical protein
MGDVIDDGGLLIDVYHLMGRYRITPRCSIMKTLRRHKCVTVAAQPEIEADADAGRMIRETNA